ncbi:CheR family methyltransferase [Roseiflexus sp.]|uniref:CheR family methyltransferase n=1 Tax=Roseiflexus sp. TaxID=2562120 RepID=UPI00398B7B90
MHTLLSDELYQQFRDLLLTRSGLFFPDHRRNDLHHYLTTVLTTTGHQSLEALYAAASVDEHVLRTLIEGVTVGETYFFRNAAQFDALRTRIIPDLIERRGAIRSLRFWSAGCATGEEPYSLAILLRETLPDPPSWQVAILATDINTTFLERARVGVYGAWSFRETPAAVREQYFEQTGAARWRIASGIRQQVLFARLNLIEDEYPAVMNGTSMQDVILCRNVLIYFDDETIRTVVRRLYHALTPGGWLIVGHAEARSDFFAAFETINCPGTVIYRKPLQAPLFEHPAPLITASPLRPPLPTVEHAPSGVESARAAASLPATPAADANATLLARKRHPSSHHGTSPQHTSGEADVLAAARQAADRGDLQTALHLCTAMIERQPLCAEAHLLTGQILEHQERFDDAIAAYRRAIYLDHTLHLASLAIAVILQRTGRISDARRSYERLSRALAALPPDAPAPSLGNTTVAELQAFIQRQVAALRS